MDKLAQPDFAVLYIGRSNTECGVCGWGADPDAERHDTIHGYGWINGHPGCGVRWTHLAAVYWGTEERTKAMRPDLPFLDFDDPLWWEGSKGRMQLIYTHDFPLYGEDDDN